MAAQGEWHDYKAGEKPPNDGLFLVWVDMTWGGNKRIHIANFNNDVFISRDEAPVETFDSAVTHWHKLPPMPPI